MPLSAIRSLFRRPKSDDASTLEIDQLTYAVGDVHGRADLLDGLINRIGEDAHLDGVPTPRVVFLGDYVDRGDQSAHVLERLSGLSAETGWNVVFLRGNHEVMLTEFLSDPEAAAQLWFRNGGLETLLSFKIGGVSSTITEGSPVLSAGKALSEKIAHLSGWFEQLVPMYRAGNVVFTHAGLDPALSPEAHSEEAFYWGSGGIPMTRRQDGLWVVHGHYIVDDARISQRHIAIDTGAYYSGQLTAVRITSGSVRFIST